MTLETILNLIVGIFTSHGAHHAAVGAVNHHLGWVMSKHWLVRVCWRGVNGCGF